MKRERIYPEREKTVSLGSGLIIFKRRETGYAGGTEASHAYPVLSFRKSVGAYQTVLSPFPRCPRVDDRRVVNGIIYVIKHGRQWKDTPDEYGPHKTLCNRFIRWSRLGVFNKIFTELANKIPFDGSLMIDSAHLKAHRTAASLLKKGILHVL